MCLLYQAQGLDVSESTLSSSILMVLARYKIRLVALGSCQEYGINCETFAPVAKMTTMRTILAIAASRSWPLYQMDGCE